MVNVLLVANLVALVMIFTIFALVLRQKKRDRKEVTISFIPDAFELNIENKLNPGGGKTPAGVDQSIEFAASKGGSGK